MEYLLDIHIVLLTLTNDQRLNALVKEKMEDPENTFYYSVVSMWEVAIKYAAHKKMPISGSEFLHYCEYSGYQKFELDDRHVVALETLSTKESSSEHKDPFDRHSLMNYKTRRTNIHRFFYTKTYSAKKRSPKKKTLII